MHDSATLAYALAAALCARLVETHISWVLLARADVYKIKKPVRLGFIDYGSLSARHFFCEEEVRLGARLAPELYLGVERVGGSPGEPLLGGAGRAIEYAVHMRRFPPGALFSEMLEAGSLQPAHVDALASLLARFHRGAPRDAPSAEYGNAPSRKARAFAALEGARDAMDTDAAAAISAWLERESARLAGTWDARRAGGFVRECHGDLHLDNVAWVDGKVIAFDGIEFDAALRWTDVVDDIAFAVMDFDVRGRRDFAFRLLDGWLDLTGDHAGGAALRFGLVYRALVRAQVALLRGDAPHARGYAAAALRWTEPAAPFLAITHGLPGSGKTHESQRVLEQRGAIRLRSDVERKRLFGLGPLDDSRTLGVDIYTAEAGRRTYARLFETARDLLAAGWPVVIDAAFLRRQERDAARRVAMESRVPFWIVACEAPMEVLRARLRSRRGDASEADEHVLEQLAASAEPLTPLERALVH